jgi:hypothetical protein
MTTDPSDPAYVRAARKQEQSIITGWIEEYIAKTRAKDKLRRRSTEL